jgi:hypothetical protein
VEIHLAQGVLVAVARLQLVQMLPLEQLTEAVAVEVVQHKVVLLLAATAALVLLLFLPRLRQHQLLVHQQSRPAVAIPSTRLTLLVQSHSEAQHESFCKSRKRHRHTSYCG